MKIVEAKTLPIENEVKVLRILMDQSKNHSVSLIVVNDRTEPARPSLRQTTLWKLLEFTFTLFWQKFRESMERFI